MMLHADIFTTYGKFKMRAHPLAHAQQINELQARGHFPVFWKTISARSAVTVKDSG